MQPDRRLRLNWQFVQGACVLLVVCSMTACGGSSDPIVSEQITPRTAAVDGNGRLKVFILAGQSNMQGFGKVEVGADLTDPNQKTRPPLILGGAGSLRALVNEDQAGAYKYLLDPVKTVTYTVNNVTKTYPAWATRNDVWISNWGNALGSPTESNKGALTVGFGSENRLPAGYIGPEFAFGHIVGNALGDKVLLIKTSWGGKSLAVDFRPPSSGGTLGPYYKEIVDKVRMVLADVKKYYPAYDGKGVEIAGFGWHQGFNDRVTAAYAAEYEVNLANLIRDVRKDLGVPTMPFVIANTGMANANSDAQALKVIAAQGNVSDPKKYPEFVGTVSTVDTRPFDFPFTSPETAFGHHWYYSGLSYFRIGEHMGNAMIKLMAP